ncbi:adenylate kinase [Verrucomicrobiota bacterium]
MKAIVLLGAPGAGKGTTAEAVKGRTAFLHVSTGDMLRRAVKNGTDLGRRAESYMKQGELVPDELMTQLIDERLVKEGPEALYVFDGYPRTVNQAEQLEQSLERHGGRLDRVFLLDAPRPVLIERLTGRRICRQCGRNYHVVNVPPAKDGVCDACGGELYQRSDDTEDTIVNRLEVYERQTHSLIARYEAQGLLVRVDAGQQADRMAADVMAELPE